MAWLRIWGLADSKSDPAITGDCPITAGCAATSAMVAALQKLNHVGPAGHVLPTGPRSSGQADDHSSPNRRRLIHQAVTKNQR